MFYVYIWFEIILLLFAYLYTPTTLKFCVFLDVWFVDAIGLVWKVLETRKSLSLPELNSDSQIIRPVDYSLPGLSGLS